MRPALAVGLVFAGCCSNVIFLELLARKHPGCGNIVTFAQFLFIAVEGFLFEADLGRKPPAIPIRYYAIMVTMFFTVSVVNNYALNLNIAMPLHMIFRSGSLIHPHHGVRLPHRHARRDPTQICEPHLFHLVLPEPLHPVALAGHPVCLHWDLNVHRGVEQPRDHKK
uniref:Isoform 2 of Nucleotide sugar transporter SLC35B4 n=1 Tax=Macaca fascicularis TaxID=9541 RepID=Q95KB4-2